MSVNVEVASEILGSIGQLWLEQSFSDLDIEIDGDRFLCHRLMLCACSKFFKNVLLTDRAKNEEHRSVTLKIRNMPPSVFKIVLDAVYTGVVPLTTDNMIELWQWVHRLEIPVLLSLCEKFVSSHLSQYNIRHILVMAFCLESRYMMGKCFEYLVKEFKHFSKTTQNSFMMMSCSTVQELISVLESSEQVSRDECVHFILLWVEFDQANIGLRSNNQSQVIAFSGDQEVAYTSCLEKGSMSSLQSLTESTYRTSIISTDDIIEITFQKLSGTANLFHMETEIRDPVNDRGGRKQYLGALLRKVGLDKISRECLQTLKENDIVMGSKESRDLLRQTMDCGCKKETLNGEAVTPEISRADDVTENVVVYKSNSDCKLYAYSLETSKIFHMSNCFVSFAYKMHSSRNTLFALNDSKNALTAYTNDFSKPILNISVFATNAIRVGDFVYFTQNRSMLRRHATEKNAVTVKLFSITEDSGDYSLISFHNHIILYRSKFEKAGILLFVYHFDSDTNSGRCVYRSPMNGHGLVCFESETNVFILTNTGYCLNVIPGLLSAGLSPKEVQGRYLWAHPLKSLYGAVVYEKRLIVFTNLVEESQQLKPPTPGQHKVFAVSDVVAGVESIHLAHLYEAECCSFMTLPKKLLSVEV